MIELTPFELTVICLGPTAMGYIIGRVRAQVLEHQRRVRAEIAREALGLKPLPEVQA